MKLKYKLFAIDFDNTIAYDKYPEIGDLIPGAKKVIDKIKEYGGEIILWTCRTDKPLENAKEFLEKNKITYDYFNESSPHNINLYGGDTRKVFADVYIDDRCILWKGKPVDWFLVESLIFEYEEWQVGDTIEAMEDCWGNFKKGEQFQIHELKEKADFISFGPVGGAGYWDTQEYFKKVQ